MPADGRTAGGLNDECQWRALIQQPQLGCAVCGTWLQKTPPPCDRSMVILLCAHTCCQDELREPQRAFQPQGC